MHPISRNFAAFVGIIGLSAMLAGACSEPKDADTSPEPVAVKADAESGCAVAGELRTTLYGAIQVDIDWQAAALTCAGMPRPNGEGVRLRFAGQSDGRDLAIIVSMPEFDREATAKEFASTVTIIEEGSARFFNSPDLGNCWTEIETLEPIGDQQDDSSDAFVIGGGLYCVSPLAELNGDGSVTLNEMQFLGLLDWNAR